MWKRSNWRTSLKKQKIDHPYTRLKAPNWVNVLAVTEEKEVILVEQTRVGPMRNVLEVPGGVIDPGENPLDAARRELEEETGYISQEFLSLGKINPNPAIMTNELHMFVALNCKKNTNREHFPDQNESLEVHVTPGSKILNLIENNRIDSALAALTMMKGQQYWRN